MSEPSTMTDLFQQLTDAIEQGDPDRLGELYEQNTSGDLARAISYLPDATQSQLLSLLGPEIAADLMEDISVTQAVELLDDLPADEAARIVGQMVSDDAADVLSQLDDADAILDAMDPEDAQEARELIRYEPDEAGGLMITEYLRYPDNLTVSQVIADLRDNVADYSEYDVQYLYIVGARSGKLRGVVRMRELLFTPGSAPITQPLLPEARSVNDHATLDELEDFFERYHFYAAPVVDEHNRLVGVVRKAHVHEALGDRAQETLLRLGGIVGGEELRSMSTAQRSARRLAFLGPTLMMGMVSVSVIAFFEHIIAARPALAIFLPLLAGLAGASGNQAIAVTIREIALGLAQPADALRVMFKEMKVGLAMGVLLGLWMFGMAWFMRGDLLLAGVVASATPIAICIAVVLGSGLPLVVKRFNLDPAMSAAPLMTVVVDLSTFFIILGLASLTLVAATVAMGVF